MQSVHRCGADSSAGEHCQPYCDSSFNEVIFECVKSFWCAYAGRPQRSWCRTKISFQIRHVPPIAFKNS
jgi:hypothetical protein